MAKGNSVAMFTMEEASPHQIAAGPHQIDANPHQAESRGSQHGDPRRSIERRESREGSVRITHTSKSQSRGKSHVSYAKNDRDMQREIDELRSCVMLDEDVRRPAPGLPPRRRTMLVIDKGSEPCPVRLLPMKRSTTASVSTKVRRAGAWGITP